VLRAAAAQVPRRSTSARNTGNRHTAGWNAFIDRILPGRSLQIMEAVRDCAQLHSSDSRIGPGPEGDAAGSADAAIFPKSRRVITEPDS